MDIATSTNGSRFLKAWFGVLLLFLYAPLLILLVFSFNDNNLPIFPLKGFTTQAYQDFVANAELRTSLVTSAKVAAATSVVAVVLGILAATVLVRRRFLGKSLTSAVLLSPLVVPYIALAIGLVVFLHETPGIDVGFKAIVIGHVVISIPYTVLILAPRLERLDVRLEEAARDLGAGSLQTFRLITFPLILPAVVSALLVAFVLSFDEIVIASFVAGETTTFPLYLFSQLRFPTLLPQVIAVAVIVMAASTLLLIAAEVGRRIVERRLGTEPTEITAPTAAEPAAVRA